MVGITAQKEGGTRMSVKASSRSFNRPKSPTMQLPLNAAKVLTTLAVLSSMYFLYERICSTSVSIETVCSNNISDDPFILQSTCLPSDDRFYPTTANGFIGYKLFGDTIFMNGLYNGKGGASHRAKIPNTINYITLPPTNFLFKIQDTEYSHDMQSGLFSVVKTLDSMKIEQLFYTHRLLTRLLVSEISVTITKPGHYELHLHSTPHHPSTDIAFSDEVVIHYNSSLCSDCEYALTATAINGTTLIAEEEFSAKQNVTVISTIFPSKIKIQAEKNDLPLSKTFVFLTSVAHTHTEADYFYKKGLESIQSRTLRSSHVKQWNETWEESDIDVKGNLFMNRVIRSSLYYLHSAFPPLNAYDTFPFKFYGASPGGLSNGGEDQDYFGHVFWDQDFWMVPGLLPLFPEIAKTVIMYRVRNLVAACKKAKQLSHLGAAYPWEAAFTGFDVCPGEEYVEREIHITGDVVHLLKQYVHLTGDWDIFNEHVENIPLKVQRQSNDETYSFHVERNNGDDPCAINEQLTDSSNNSLTAWQMLKETAFFWQSRVTWNETLTKYEINNVMGPDEWHSCVNNSVFTNVIAANNLKFAADVAMKLKICPQLAKKLKSIAEEILIPFDSTLNYHPEFEGFKPEPGIVKQADAIMLGFPLQYKMPDKVKTNDLAIYENATSHLGPAMTWGVFSINLLSIGEETKAASMFLRQLENVQPPFNIWSEYSNGMGAVNFLTGIGGFLQSIVYGYFGLRIEEECLTIKPTMLPSHNSETIREMSINGIRYKSFKFKISVTASNITLILLNNTAKETTCLNILVVSSGRQYSLCKEHSSVVFAREECKITLSDNS